jgi:formylglycine-generating enzyme required for sulfatase activity
MEDAHVTPKPLPPGFRARPGVGVHASGWPWEITCDKDGAAMVLVPGGEFVQGTNNGPSNERPARKITLGSFYIDQHEVTIGQYQLYVKDLGKKPTVAIPPGPSDLPMTQINARDARDYDRWAGKELPTEAQWEMAGRATDERIHPWGNTPAEWIKPRAAKQIDPVASFPGDLSPYRVFDLAGNAWEWTNDPFVLNAAPASKSKAKSTLVTIKGGSKDWLLAWRDGVPVTSKFAHLGFRGVLSVEGSPAAPNPGQPTAPGVLRQGGSPF